MRCHGDLHLGQFLYTGKDFIIIDFEGESWRPLSDRRRKRSAIRDVASVALSFHYHAMTALHEQLKAGALGERDYEAVEPFANLWHTWSAWSYLKGYLETVGKAPFAPKDREELRVLFDAFRLEKALRQLETALTTGPISFACTCTPSSRFCRPWPMADHARMGANVESDGSTRFRVWAPRVREMAVEIVGAESRAVAMDRSDDGHFEAQVTDAGHGTDYLFVLDGTKKRPDPCSRWQPHGVHGASRVLDARAFSWTDGDFRGIGLSELVLYELHVGTFTPEGTFDRDHPEAPLPRRSRGHRHRAHARRAVPRRAELGLRRRVPLRGAGELRRTRRTEEARRRRARPGLAVELDVVYNHLGPEGNYLADFGPYFTDRYTTPWGDRSTSTARIRPGARVLPRERAHWLTDFHVDGLRLDAIQCIFDMGARHFLEETGGGVPRASARARPARAHHRRERLERRARRPAPARRTGSASTRNGATTSTTPSSPRGPAAQHGYFDDFGAVADVAKALTKGSSTTGNSRVTAARRHGNSSAREPGERVRRLFCRTTTRWPNAWHGERLSRDRIARRSGPAAALLFTHLAPRCSSWARSSAEIAPFDFFTSHSDPGLIEAVRRGRARAPIDGARPTRPIPRTNARSARRRSTGRASSGTNEAAMLRLYRDLAALRRTNAALSNGRRDRTCDLQRVRRGGSSWSAERRRGRCTWCRS